MTVFGVTSLGTPTYWLLSPATWTWLMMAKAVIAMNMLTAMPPSNASVVAAFLLLGFWKAGTPLLIASTPVSAVQPDANARSNKNASASPTKCSVGFTPQCALSARSCCPDASFITPTTISAPTPNMKAYVGIANAVPDSRKPRRLSSMMTSTMATASSTSCPANEPTAEVMLATPELTDTATVST